jgi:hypothetical protein
VYCVCKVIRRHTAGPVKLLTSLSSPYPFEIFLSRRYSVTVEEVIIRNEAILSKTSHIVRRYHFQQDFLPLLKSVILYINIGEKKVATDEIDNRATNNFPELIYYATFEILRKKVLFAFIIYSPRELDSAHSSF